MLFSEDTNRYYVYVYLRKSNLTPYYVGKGHGYRAYASDHNVKVPTDKFRIIIVEKNLTNVGACAIERQLIRWYGRKDIDTGILRNKTDGGDRGTAGLKHTELTKSKISTARKGKQLSREAIERIKAANKGRKLVHSASFKKGDTPWNLTYRLKVVTPENKTSWFNSVWEYEKESGHKQRNIYYLAKLYPDIPIKRGKYKGYIFNLESLTQDIDTTTYAELVPAVPSTS